MKCLLKISKTSNLWETVCEKSFASRVKAESFVAAYCEDNDCVLYDETIEEHIMTGKKGLHVVKVISVVVA